MSQEEEEYAAAAAGRTSARVLQERIDGSGVSINKFTEEMAAIDSEIRDQKTDATRISLLKIERVEIETNRFKAQTERANVELEAIRVKTKPETGLAQIMRRGEPPAKLVRLAGANLPSPYHLLHFIQVLPQAQLQGDFLIFSQAWWGRGLTKMPLLVRDCYSFFYDKLLELQKSREVLNMVITGSSGAGKSAFGLYAFWRLVAERRFPVLYEVKDYPAVLFAVEPMERVGVSGAGVYEVSTFQREETIKELCNFRELVRIQDPYDDVPIRVPGSCFNVILSAPDEQRFKILHKDEARTTLLYMDLWSEEELVLTANELRQIGGGGPYLKSVAERFLAEDAVRERFYKYGGSARAVFSLKMDIPFEKAIWRFAMSSIEKVFSIENLNGYYSSMVVHYTPVLPDRTEWEPVLASPYVAIRLFEMFKRGNPKELYEFMTQYRGTKYFEGLYVAGYKSLMHDVIKAGGTFTLEDEFRKSHSFVLPPLQSRQFQSKLSELGAVNANDYCLPLMSNFAGLHSVAFLPRNLLPGGDKQGAQLCAVGFQVGSKHDILITKGLNEIIVAAAGEMLGYKPEMFVVFVTDNAEFQMAPQTVKGNLPEEMKMIQYMLRHEIARKPVTV